MKTKFGVPGVQFIGIIAIAALIVFTMAACSDEDSIVEKTVTFHLQQISDTSFTLTVQGAKWIKTPQGAGLKCELSVTTAGPYSVTSTGLALSEIFDGVRTTDTMITYTRNSYYPGTLKGTVKIDSDRINDLGSDFTDAEDGLSKVTYKVGQSSVTF